jgi:hypothetical protein
MEPSLLICAQPFDSLEAHAVAAAVADGLTAAGRPQPDILELPAASDAKLLLAEHGFDQRMRAAFAVVVCTEYLRDGELRGTLAAEISTSARQAGVACHAICAENAIAPFTARIYDLQTIRIAATSDQLRHAAGFLADEL